MKFYSRFFCYLILVAVLVSTGCNERYGGLTDFTVMKESNHPELFTQGFEMYEGSVIESSGLYGMGKVVRYDIETGNFLGERKFQNRYFLEGLTVLDGKLYLLTWKEQKVFVLDPLNFEQSNVFGYDGEGWGITNDSNYLIMSNGSDELTYRDPDSFDVVRTIKVQDGSRSVDKLNELEFFDGYIWANVWKTALIVAINPSTGAVVHRLDVSALEEIASVDGDEESVANGIAYDSQNEGFWVTGKRWKSAYLIQLSHGK